MKSHGPVPPPAGPRPRGWELSALRSPVGFQILLLEKFYFFLHILEVSAQVTLAVRALARTL